MQVNAGLGFRAMRQCVAVCGAVLCGVFDCLGPRPACVQFALLESAGPRLWLEFFDADDPGNKDDKLGR